MDAFKSPVVLSLTTSPIRIKYLPIVLNCLDLTRVQEIQLNLPRLFGRNKQPYVDIPASVIDYPKLKIYWYPVDDGPLMKILNTIERQTDPEAICISIDDDILLGRDCINVLISAQIALQGRACVGSQGGNLKSFLDRGKKGREFSFFQGLWPQDRKTVQPVGDLQPIDLVEGFGGISYRARHLNPERLRQFAQADKKCYMSDDIVLNTQMQESGIPRFRAPNIHCRPLRYGDQSDALHNLQDHYSSYGVCLDKVKPIKQNESSV